MERNISWAEMKSMYPDEWLLITDFKTDDSGHLLNGVVERHSKKKDEVYRLPSLEKPTAFRFSGESTFSGLRSHATIHNLF